MAIFDYALFYDFHTLATNPDVGKNFDVEAFTDQVKSCGVDFLTFHARCNQGNAYYNTEIGTRHPSLTYDLIGKLCDSCKRKNIRLSLYFNGHLSEEETLANPQWSDVPLDPAARERNKRSPFYHQVCYNRFGGHLRDMAVELAQNYDFDGFFFDCLGASDCVCPQCVAEMKEKGYDWNDPVSVRDFSHFSCDRMCRMLTEAIRKIKPDSLLFFNGRPFEEVTDLESHLECECLPTGGWGYDCLPSCAHYMRTIAGKDKSVLNMTGRFNAWGDFGGLRTAQALEYDMFYGVANGQRPDIGGHYHPRGDLDLPVFDRIREVYDNVRQYDKWSLHAENEVDVAIVYPRYNRHYYPASPLRSVPAAVRMLDELKVQFDLVTDFVSWDKYSLLIIPDDAVFTPSMVEKLQKHIARGGSVIASGSSTLLKNGKEFPVKDWPVKYVGKIPYDPLYFVPAGKFAETLPDMFLSLYADGTQVEASEGAKVEMYCAKPYVNGQWDGLRGNFYLPPEGATKDPFVVQKGKVVYIAGNLFAGYASHAPKELRELIRKIMEELHSTPILKTENMPSFSRAFVQQKDSYRMVHLLAYCPEKRCNAIIAEDRITVSDAKISLKVDGKKINKVYLAPNGKVLPFEIKDGYCNVTVPRFDGYSLLVFEE